MRAWYPGDGLPPKSALLFHIVETECRWWVTDIRPVIVLYFHFHWLLYDRQVIQPLTLSSSIYHLPFLVLIVFSLGYRLASDFQQFYRFFIV